MDCAGGSSSRVEPNGPLGSFQMGGLRMRLMKGNERYLKSASAAHLFRRGRAKTAGSHEHGVSLLNPLDLPWSDEYEGLTGSKSEAHLSVSRPEQHRPVPARSIFGPKKHKYHNLRKSGRTVFVQLPEGTKLKPF